MQHSRADVIRQYLLLVRLPNVFTTPSNILVGYFAVIPLASTNSLQFVLLMLSSGLLYSGGIVLNDYFDIEIDRKERPFRPLASSRIPREQAMLIAASCLISANLVALTVSLQSLGVSAILTTLIVVYDFRIKQGPFGPFVMAATRALNIILGASPLLGSISPIAIAAAGLLFVYIIAIMVLSRNEVGEKKPHTTISSLIVISIVALLLIIGFLLHLHQSFLVCFTVFSLIMLLILRTRHKVQQTIKNMVISIVLFDSVFVSGETGLIIGLAVMLFTIPPIILARWLYVT